MSKVSSLFYLQTLTSFPPDRKAPNSEFRTALLRLYRPLRKRLTPLLYIFRLCSQLQGSPLVWQLFSSQAPTFSCQPLPGVICMSAVLHGIYSTQHQHNPEHITSHQVPTQSRPAVSLLPRARNRNTKRRVRISSRCTPALHMMRRHLIKGGKEREVFPTFSDITFKSGPTRWDGEKKSVIFTLKIEMCWWDNVTEGVDGFNCTAFKQAEDPISTSSCQTRIHHLFDWS